MRSQKSTAKKKFKKLFQFYESGRAFCAFDTETTGLDSEKDRVIEIGAVKFTKDGGISDTFSRLVHVDFPLPEICKKLSHITDDMLQNQPEIDAVLKDFLDFASSSVLVAHNSNFDVRFVRAECVRAGMRFPAFEVVDTLALSRWLYPNNGHWNLQFLASQFEIDVRAAHRAYDDARVCKEIMERCFSDAREILS